MNVYRRGRSALRQQIESRFGRVDVRAPYELGGGEHLRGSVALVTGGAGEIGRATAARLAADGATVYICGRNGSTLAAVAEELGALSLTTKPLVGDISTSAGVDQIFSAINDEHGRLDVLVNSAGGSARGKHLPIHEQSVEVIDEILKVNLRGTMLCTRAAAKLMVGRNSGSIVNVTSVIGSRGRRRFAEYSAAKAGVIGFTRSTAMDLGEHGVRVNCVSPGIVPRGVIPEWRAEDIRRTNYLGSIGTAEDIAEAIGFLASARARFITGQDIVIDGGRSLGLRGE